MTRMYTELLIIFFQNDIAHKEVKFKFIKWQFQDA